MIGQAILWIYHCRTSVLHFQRKNRSDEIGSASPANSGSRSVNRLRITFIIHCGIGIAGIPTISLDFSGLYRKLPATCDKFACPRDESIDQSPKRRLNNYDERYDAWPSCVRVSPSIVEVSGKRDGMMRNQPEGDNSLEQTKPYSLEAKQGLSWCVSR
jgi:hypothetical protein